ncbi:MAG TPA: HWE histidine kinase domain-containing protein, partial [Allosphingosinicella sp.]|nr:HWE histidine kinase domain-containing protein [Allosphingosinicella sp.]
MAEAIRAFDWASTPLGPKQQWPVSLKLAYDLCQSASVMSAVYWGPDYILIYNPVWAAGLPTRHPDALGRPAAEVWSDVWHLLRPDFDQVYREGAGRTLEAQMLPLEQHGITEETYWTYSLTPIRDEQDQVRGIYLQGADVTRAVVNERRLSFQVALADRLRGLHDPQEVKRAASAMLGEYLDVARVGFVEVDEEEDRISLSGEWVRGEGTGALQGSIGRLSALPKGAVDYLRSGEVLVLPDVDNVEGGSSDADAEIGKTLGVRAVITVPLVRDGKLRAMLYVHEPEVRNWKRSEAAMARDVGERSWGAVERAEAEQRLRESEDHYRHAVELNPQVSWTSLPNGQLNRVSRRWFEWTGTLGTGESWAGGLHPDDVEATFAAWGRSIETGEPYDIEHRVKHRDGSYRWARSRAFPRRDERDDICLWYGTTEDIHERKVAEEHQRLLINELNHRVKNTLATVQAIAFQTLKGDLSLPEARARFEARLLALSNAHNLLTDQNWEGAPLRRVIEDSVQPLAGERSRFLIEGKELWLVPRAALALALAVHELSTNAVKY